MVAFGAEILRSRAKRRSTQRSLFPIANQGKRGPECGMLGLWVGEDLEPMVVPTEIIDFSQEPKDAKWVLY